MSEIRKSDREKKIQVTVIVSIVSMLMISGGLYSPSFAQKTLIKKLIKPAAGSTLKETLEKDSSKESSSSVQSIEKISSDAVNHMKKIYQLSKCETDRLDNINLSKVDFEDEQMAREVDRMSGGNVEQKERAMLSWRKQQEGNLAQRISATKTLLEEVDHLSRQIADIWEPGVALDSRCIE